MNSVEYVQGSDLPDFAIEWYDSSGNLIDFSGSWSFQLKIGFLGDTALITKTAGITGTNTAPNVTISWSQVGELNALPADQYFGQLKATRVDGKERYMMFSFNVSAGIL